MAVKEEGEGNWGLLGLNCEVWVQEMKPNKEFGVYVFLCSGLSGLKKKVGGQRLDFQISGPIGE